MASFLKDRLALLALVIALLCTWQTYANRYYLRFLPIPVSMAEIVNRDSWWIPDFEPSTPLGAIDLGDFDLRTEDGLRKTLNFIQELSPPNSDNQLPSYDGTDFEAWAKKITINPIFCTDGSYLIILAAERQGLKAREWHLLPRGWPSGQGHSVVEIFNPSTDSWQLVDAQHGAIVRGRSGEILDMVTVLKMYSEKAHKNIWMDYGPYKEQMLNGMRGASSEVYFFETDQLETPVLQLRTGTWFASVERNFGLSGHFVIGYPILMDGWTHDHRVWWSKLTAFGMAMFGGLFLIRLFRRRGTG